MTHLTEGTAIQFIALDMWHLVLCNDLPCMDEIIQFATITQHLPPDQYCVRLDDDSTETIHADDILTPAPGWDGSMLSHDEWITCRNQHSLMPGDTQALFWTRLEDQKIKVRREVALLQQKAGGR